MSSRDYLELSFRSIECFSNDGKLDADELRSLLTIAEQDGHIDQDEIRVLNNIISRIKPEEIDEDLKSVLQNVHKKINAPADK